MKFTQTISDKNLKKAIYLHYFGSKYTYVAPVLGILLFLATSVLFVLSPCPEIPKLGGRFILLLLISSCLALRPWYYVQNVFKSISSDTTTIEISDDYKLTTGEKESSFSVTVNISDLHSYAERKNFLFLYASRAQFLILDKKQMTEEQEKTLLGLLTEFQIRLIH